MIDICDFAVGLSETVVRIYNDFRKKITSIVRTISSFRFSRVLVLHLTFPVAVWSWNVALAWVCGNVCIWKPSEKTPLCGIASCPNLIIDVLKENNIDEGVSCVVNGGAVVGSWIADDKRISLVSAQLDLQKWE